MQLSVFLLVYIYIYIYTSLRLYILFVLRPKLLMCKHASASSRIQACLVKLYKDCTSGLLIEIIPFWNRIKGMGVCVRICDCALCVCVCMYFAYVCWYFCLFEFVYMYSYVRMCEAMCMRV